MENIDTNDINKINHINDVLVKVAKTLDNANINYAVGASKLLEQFDFVVSDDIDIFIARKHLDNVEKVLDDIGQRVEIPFDGNYISKGARCYNIDNVIVKIISGLTIRHASGLYQYDFSNKDDFYKIKINDYFVKFMYLEDWFIFYLLIPNKATYSKMILQYFKSNNYRPNVDFFKGALNKSIPQFVRETLEKLIIMYG